MKPLGLKVLITTKFGGVFFGTLSRYARDTRHVTLTDARNCVYWPSSNHGFLGLAKDGPKEGARIGPKVSILDLAGVTSVAVCSDEAIAKWEAGQWS